MTLFGPVELRFAVGLGIQTPLCAESTATGSESWLCITLDQRLTLKMSAVARSEILIPLLTIIDVFEVY